MVSKQHIFRILDKFSVLFPRFSEIFIMAGTKRKKDDSPLTSKTLSKIKLMSQPEIIKFIQDMGSKDNPEIEESIAKQTEIGLDYLKGFCLLNKTAVGGETISEIVTALIDESLVNKYI